jgi:hypothetical protein
MKAPRLFIFQIVEARFKIAAGIGYSPDLNHLAIFENGGKLQLDVQTNRTAQKMKSNTTAIGACE